MRFIPHTEQDIREMLEKIGLRNIDELFASIPDTLRLRGKVLDLPPALSETELVSTFKHTQKRNPDPDEMSTFH